MKKRLRVLFSGNVQGVGFRFTSESIAKSLCLAGWVKNLRDGHVELVAEQDEDILKEFLSRIEDQFAGYIRDKVVSWSEASGEFKDFGIKF